ncbi:MAG: 3-dehydroquinate synthase [SAR324 cluster bacterium]|nr:3-dehydroquinate synthase [SAR324 cluster bacterium]
MPPMEQRICVNFAFPVHFTQDLFAERNPVFVETVSRLERDKRHRVVFVIDDNVAAAHPGLIPSINRYFTAHAEGLELIAPPTLVPGGEGVKNDIAHVLGLVELVHRHGVDRHSFMAIVGGGAVLDMACFAAAIAHRGIRAIRIPTTVLAQDDSAVGVKNAINLFGKKNFIGTFLPPFAVLNDSNFLTTLSHRDKIAGMAEAIKVALIRDRTFFQYLEANRARMAQADMEVLTHLIRRSAEIHMNHIRTSGDPFEFGSARPLDFGHWAAHKMESLTQNRLRHGEAVALGMAMDTRYSVKAGLLSPNQSERIISLLQTLGFRLWEDELLSRDEMGNLEVLQGLREFREHLGGTLHITLLRDIGDGVEVNEMDEALVLESIHWLRDRYERHAQGTGARAATMVSG